MKTEDIKNYMGIDKKKPTQIQIHKRIDNILEEGPPHIYSSGEWICDCKNCKKEKDERNNSK